MELVKQKWEYGIEMEYGIEILRSDINKTVKKRHNQKDPGKNEKVFFLKKYNLFISYSSIVVSSRSVP